MIEERANENRVFESRECACCPLCDVRQYYCDFDDCIRDSRRWMLEDKLMLNDDKSEGLLIGTPKQLAKTSIESIKLARSLSNWLIQP